MVISGKMEVHYGTSFHLFSRSVEHFDGISDPAPEQQPVRLRYLPALSGQGREEKVSSRIRLHFAKNVGLNRQIDEKKHRFWRLFIKKLKFQIRQSI